MCFWTLARIVVDSDARGFFSHCLVKSNVEGFLRALEFEE